MQVIAPQPKFITYATNKYYLFGGGGMTLIYKITNSINDKVYVGQTQCSLMGRFGRHLADADKYPDRKLYIALAELGWRNFDIALLEECPDNKANERETYWIDYYDSFKKGYNSNYGGTGNKVRFEEAKALYDKGLNCIQIADELNVCPEVIRTCLKDNGIEVRKIQGTDLDVNAMPIYQLSLEGKVLNRYFSAREAGRQLGNEAYNAHIRECASGLRKSAYGFLWKWEKDCK